MSFEPTKNKIGIRLAESWSTVTPGKLPRKLSRAWPLKLFNCV